MKGQCADTYVSEPPERPPDMPVLLQCCCFPAHHTLLVTSLDTITALLQHAPLLVTSPDDAKHWSRHPARASPACW
jgi:hypothetical protein